MNEDTDESLYIALGDSSFKHQSWEEHIVSNVFSVDIAHKSDLLESPNKNGISCQGVNWEDIFLKPIIIKNEWLKVMWEDEKKNKRYGWIKWKEGNKLLIEFFYFA